MGEFWAKYKDPRWQRRRLEILQIADFSCSMCESTEKTLHVHHKHYRKGAMPWEYEDHELQALCADCHELQHGLKDALTAALSRLGPGEFMTLLGYAEASALGFPANESIHIRDGEHAVGVGAYYGIGYMGVMELMDKAGDLEINKVVDRLGI